MSDNEQQFINEEVDKNMTSLLINMVGIKKIYRHITEAVMIYEVSEKFILKPNDDIVFANENDCSLVVSICIEGDNCIVNCLSSNRRIRALEFLDYLFGKYGIVEGNSNIAKGKMSKIILDVFVSEANMNNEIEYLLSKINEYFTNTEIIDCMVNDINIDKMKRYHKKHMPWSYVKTVDVCPKGKQICVRSLENKAGEIIMADENVYIMIGSRGEVYTIKKNKFESSYEATDEVLDIFELMLESIPTVVDVDTGNCIAIDELAHICYPRIGNGIYAKELEKRTKVFGINNQLDYFIGKKGDYLAVRTDDLHDAYIIKKDIFYGTYEEAK